MAKEEFSKREPGNQSGQLRQKRGSLPRKTNSEEKIQVGMKKRKRVQL